MGKGPSSFYSSVWLCDVTAPEVVVGGGGVAFSQDTGSYWWGRVWISQADQSRSAKTHFKGLLIHSNISSENKLRHIITKAPGCLCKC